MESSRFQSVHATNNCGHFCTLSGEIGHSLQPNRSHIWTTNVRGAAENFPPLTWDIVYKLDVRTLWCLNHILRWSCTLIRDLLKWWINYIVCNLFSGLSFSCHIYCQTGPLWRAECQLDVLNIYACSVYVTRMRSRHQRSFIIKPQVPPSLSTFSHFDDVRSCGTLLHRGSAGS